LTYGCIYYVGWDAEKLTKQIHRFSNMPVDESNRAVLSISLIDAFSSLTRSREK
jgi:hypothetical protein